MPNPMTRILGGKNRNRLSVFAEDVILSDGTSVEEHAKNADNAHGRRVATLDEVDEIQVFSRQPMNFSSVSVEPPERKFDAFWEAASQKKREEI